MKLKRKRSDDLGPDDLESDGDAGYTNEVYGDEEEFEEDPMPAAKPSARRSSKAMKKRPRTEANSYQADFPVIPDDDEFNPVHPDDAPSNVKDGKSTDLLDRFDPDSFDRGPDKTLPPLSEIPEIFEDMVKKAMSTLGLKSAVEHLCKRTLRVATMCSGTESPIIALKLILEYIQKELELEEPLGIKHLFSAEIVPFKQAFIQLNFSPELLFRDIIEMAESKDGKATTAFGGRESIPTDVDILVAGFSCVDMSNLNNKKVSLAEMGESGDTLRAIICYAVKYEPKVIVLENVDGAPWEPGDKTKAGESVSELWLKAGYYCQLARVDTKNFYIPHTRLRGYMVCVRSELLTTNPFDRNHPKFSTKFATIVSGHYLFKKGVEKLARNASEPVEAFILPETDERVVRGDSEEPAAANRLVNWGTCEASHATYRQVNLLGSMKPITKWTLGGSSQPRDVVSQTWIKDSVERIKESLDIMYLRNLRRGFDPFYKNRMLDLSQNIDRRTMDLGASGYTGCVTPSGMPYSTVLGRLLIAEEALKLQGMDPDTMNVSLLSQRELRDLAGNAMSCPTIGAVLLVALSLTYKAIPQTSSEEIIDAVSEVDRIENLATEVGSSTIKFGRVGKLSFFTQRILDRITLSLRHCSCEGQTGFASSNLVQCLDCGHKACKKHSANPKHNYEDVKVSRHDPMAMKFVLERSLPMSVTFQFTDLQTVLKQLAESLEKFPLAAPREVVRTREPVIAADQGLITDHFPQRPVNSEDPADSDDPASFEDSANPKLLAQKYWQVLKELVIKSQASGIHFRGIDRTDSCLKCTFESGGDARGALRLQLVFSPKGTQWYLYIKTPKDQPVNSSLRALLDQPIARMRFNIPSNVEQQDILRGDWELRLPETEEFDITIQGTGECVPSFEFLQGLSPFREVTVWSQLDIAVSGRSAIVNGHNISGRYTLHQKCHLPLGTFYKKEAVNDEEPVYLFLDPSRYGHPDEDSFVFSTDVTPLRFREIRFVIARLDNKWRPNSGVQSWADRTGKKDDKGRLIVIKQPGLDRKYQPPTTNTAVQVQCSVQGSWRPVDACLQITAKGKYSHIDKFSDLGRVFPQAADDGSDQCNSCYTSIKALDVSVDAQNLGIDNTMTSSTDGSGWNVVTAKDSSKFLGNLSWIAKRTCNVGDGNRWHWAPESFVKCHVCAAPLPAVKWKLQGRKWTATEVNRAKRTKYETIPKISTTSADEVLVPYEDPQSGIAYEKALKARPSPFVVQYRMENEATLRLVIGVNVKTLIHRAAASLLNFDDKPTHHVDCAYRFSTECNIEKAPLARFTIPDNVADSPAPNPPRFKVNLYPHQAKSLSWMISQEAGARFKEERIVEANLKELKWRVEGRATRKVKVRGGILADQVGYGKTALILGLFASQYKQQLKERRQWDDQIEINATLILVPNHLVDQWYNEFDKFLPRGDGGFKVVCIKNIKDWQSTTVQTFVDADVVICPWTLVEDKLYLERVALLSGMLPFPKGAGIRAEKAWYETARQHLLNTTQKLRWLATDGLLNNLASQYADHWEEGQSNAANTPSFRLRGAARREAQLSKKAAKDEAGDSVDIALMKEDIKAKFKADDDIGLKSLTDYQHLSAPPFEMFQFHRKVVDEYTYIPRHTSDTIAHIKSNCSWFLSGTPGLDDYVDAWRLMKLLGIDLGQPELTPGIITRQNIKDMAAEQTDSEKFRSLLHKPSFAWSKGRHEYAQKAIQTFVRQNVTPMKRFPVVHHILPVELPAIDRAIYSELATCVAASDMREKRFLGVYKGNDREDRITKIWAKDATKRAPSAAAALMKCSLVNTNLEKDEKLSNQRVEQLLQAVAKLERGLRAVQYRRSQEIKKFQEAQEAKKAEEAKKSQAKKSQKGKKAQKVKKEEEDKEETPKDMKFYDEFVQRIRENEVGDWDASRLILKLIQDYKDIPDGLADSEANDFKIDPHKKANLPTLRTLCKELRDICKQVSAAWRGARYLKSVEALRLLAKNPDSIPRDTLPLRGCCADKNEDHIFVPEAVSVECGHLYCKDCVHKIEGKCPAKFCEPPGGFFYMVHKEEFGVDAITNGANAKMMEIADLIKRIDKKDKILLFTLFPEQRVAVSKLLTSQGIDYDVLVDGDNKAGQKTSAFSNQEEVEEKAPGKKVPAKKASAKKGKGHQVLVLSIDNVCAAGSNLTIANHVIFAFPYLALTQTKYDSAMTQAIGRVCRHGQKKLIHVYHFLTLNTVDVDVFEARNGSILVHTNDIAAKGISNSELLPDAKLLGADGDARDRAVDEKPKVHFKLEDFDNPARPPEVKDWQPSGYTLVKRDIWFKGDDRKSGGGPYSSSIRDGVVMCMNGNIDAEDAEDDGDGDGEDGEGGEEE